MFGVKRPTRRPLRLRPHRLIVGLVILGLLLSGLIIIGIVRAPSRKVVNASHGPRVSDLAVWIDKANQGSSGSSTASSDAAKQATATTHPDTKTKSSSPSAPSLVGSPIGISYGGLTELSQSKLLSYFQDVKTLGATWVRWDIPWSAVMATDANSYDWADFDRIANAAQSAGLKSIGIIDYTPAWARSSGCTTDECAPADIPAYADYSAQLASRYAPKGIHTWEIWNEPNYSNFWQPSVDAGAYTILLKAAYQSIKQVDAGAVVLSGGLAATDTDGVNIAPIDFIQAIYANGGKGSFDGVALHPYTYPALPSHQANWNFWQQMSTIHDIMSANGDGNKKVWVTEFGAPTNGPGTAHTTTQLTFNYPNDFMTEAAQAEIAADVLTLYQKDGSWLGPLFWYTLKDYSNNPSSSENFFGLFKNDGTKKPAYDVIYNALH